MRTEAQKRLHAAYEANRRRQIAYGQWNPWHDAEPVRAHVRSLMRQGVSRRRIAELADVTDATLTRMLYGVNRRRRKAPPSKVIRNTAAQRILAVRATTETVAPTALIDATGTRRRLQALIANGWSRSKLADEFGLHRLSVGRYLQRDLVYARTAVAVRDLYDRLWDVPPPEDTKWDRTAASAARREAREQGWPVPMDWDEDIDDPNARPAGARRSPAVDPVAVERALVGDSVDLSPADFAEVVRIGTARGMSAAELAKVTGRSSRSVQRRRAA